MRVLPPALTPPGFWTSPIGVGLALTLASCAPGKDAPKATYVGGAACAECHQEEARMWTGSHHDLAMEEATRETVLGDFDDATFTLHGVTSTFFRRDDGFFVRTQGPDSTLADYRIAYTFGVDPLQQYLVAFPGGRYQVLGIAWDSRPAAEGGQRWFHLYPDADRGPGSPLHWTRPSQNWNTVCADCHSTDLRKGFDADSLTYSTTWSDIDVSCEACHGPGSHHVADARAAASGAPGPGAREGLTGGMVQTGRTWSIAPGAATATLSGPRAPGQVDGCAPCHARRSRIAAEGGASLHDTWLVSLLREDLYYPDGQIRDEDYEYGSFLQTKMYAAGVVCSDCHEPHSLRLRAQGNALCTRCHAAEAFDTPKHHFHEEASTGARCVECHMPTTTYMTVDARRDHGIRVPRPDLTDVDGAPNACNRCHTDRSTTWAVGAFRRWWPTAAQRPQFAETVAGARMGDPAVRDTLVQLAGDQAIPPIVRATALSLLARYPGAGQGVLRTGLADAHPLVRVGALQGIVASPPPTVWTLAGPLLDDSVAAVRVQAARTLVSLPRNATETADTTTLHRAWGVAEGAERINNDHSSAWVSLGNLRVAQGRMAEAEADYRNAMRLDETDFVAYLDLADLQRATGRDDLAGETLNAALAFDPDAGEVLHALGLLRVREGDLTAALPLLARAAKLQPTNARFAYVYGVALASSGDVPGAIHVLRAALGPHPFDADVLAALATYSRDSGDLVTALGYARRLASVRPADAGVAQLLRGLEVAGGH